MRVAGARIFWDGGELLAGSLRAMTGLQWLDLSRTSLCFCCSLIVGYCVREGVLAQFL
jgi:hypothetical protein